MVSGLAPGSVAMTRRHFGFRRYLHERARRDRLVAVEHDALAVAQALDDRLLVLHAHERDGLGGDLVRAVQDVDETPARSLEDRVRRQQHGVVCRARGDGRLHVGAGPERLLRVGEDRLQVDRAASRRHRVVDEGELPFDVAPFGRVERDLHGPNRFRCEDRIEVGLGHAELDADGIELRERHERRDRGGLREAAHVDVERARLAGKRRDDARVRDLRAGAIDVRIRGLELRAQAVGLAHGGVDGALRKEFRLEELDGAILGAHRVVELRLHVRGIGFGTAQLRGEVGVVQREEELARVDRVALVEIHGPDDSRDLRADVDSVQSDEVALRDQLDRQVAPLRRRDGDGGHDLGRRGALLAGQEALAVGDCKAQHAGYDRRTHDLRPLPHRRRSHCATWPLIMGASCFHPGDAEITVLSCSQPAAARSALAARPPVPRAAACPCASGRARSSRSGCRSGSERTRACR